MWRVYSCLTIDHDIVLLFVATVICLVGSATSLFIVEHARHERRSVWLILSAVCCGGAAWSTHFVAMLAYSEHLPISYDATWTLGSLVVGIVFFAVSLAIGFRHRCGWAGAIGAGSIAGLGVSLLHYLGMAALRLPGHLTYDLDLVVCSLALSQVFGISASCFLFGPATRHQRVGGLISFVLMLIALHFTAMGAVRVELGLGPEVGASGLSRSALAALVATTIAATLAIGLAAAVFDKKSSAALRAQAMRFRILSDSALEGLVIHRGGVLVDCNSAARRMLALGDDPKGACLYSWFASTNRVEVARWLSQRSESPLEVELNDQRGGRFIAEICGRELPLEDGSTGMVLALRDVTARKRVEAQLQYHALHDSLTDLANRRLFMQEAEKVRAVAVRTARGFTLLAIDLDGFKLVNDVHGHEAGDRLLVELSRRMSAHVREAEVLARLGGDEFAIVQTGMDQGSDAAALARRLLEVIGEPVRLRHGEVSIGASIGIAVYSDNSQSLEDVLRNADMAMYQAKADGKNTFRFFEPSMNEALSARRSLEGKLRQALGSDSISTAYQPLVDSKTREYLSFEALVRWHDPELGPISPAQLIPVAEETGLIVPLGIAVLRKACADARIWPDHLKLAVNLSPVQFRRPGLVQAVEAILQETGFPGARLELEITESVLIQNPDQTLHVLLELRALGIGIAMDDFGTGYSSLSYLQSFPFDKIKIDRAFVVGLDQHSNDTAIIKAIAALGRSLGMTVVAEGIETSQQASHVSNAGCDQLQGYLFGRPMTADKVLSCLGRSAIGVSHQVSPSLPG